MKIILGLFLTVMLVPSSAFALMIDNFSTNQYFEVVPGGTLANTVTDGGDPLIIEHERNVSATATGGSTNLIVQADALSNGAFAVSSPSGQTWTTTLQWDGFDASPLLNPTGLGGIDFTEAGKNDRFRLAILESDHPGLELSVTVYTDAANWSVFTLSGMAPIYTPTELDLLYSSFTIGGGAGADFTNIGAVQLDLIATMGAHDLQLDFLQATGVPEPTTMLLFGSGLTGLALAGRKKKLKKD